MRTRSLATLVLVLAAVLAASACGGGSDNASGGSTTTAAATGGGSSGGASTTLQLAADPNGALKYDTTTLEAKSGNVTIDFTNDSSVDHNVTLSGNGISGATTETITQGKSSLTADLPSGTYTFFCSVDGHEAAGMKGTLTVK